MEPLFKKSELTAAYLKMGIYGEQGSGKTYTASLIASGLALLVKERTGKKPPVMFLDTETGSNWIKPVFDKAGIELFTARTRAFKDLKQAVTETERANAVLIVDSITHFWEELRQSFLAAKRKRLANPNARLELPDWNVIKPIWGEFTSLYLNSNAHIILCGRSGSIYEFQSNDETNKLEMVTIGTKMAAEKGLGYEPSLLVEMTAQQVRDARQRRKNVVRQATVLKDRSRKLDGMVFIDPTFENFLPHINALNIGGAHGGFDDSRTSESLFPKEKREDRSTQREIVLDQIRSLFTIHIPGRTAEEQRRKELLLRKHFKATWAEIEKLMPLADIQSGYDSLHRDLEGAPSRYAADVDALLDDEIPDFSTQPPPKAAESGPESPRPTTPPSGLEPPEVEGEPEEDHKPSPQSSSGTDPLKAAYERGVHDFNNGFRERAVPGEYRENPELVAEWRKGWHAAKSRGRQE